ELGGVDVEVAHVRAERVASEQEPVLGAPPLTRPAEVIGGQDLRAATLELEGVEAVPRTDVEGPPAVEARRQTEARQQCGGVVDAVGADAVAEVDAVEPVDLLDGGSELGRRRRHRPILPYDPGSPAAGAGKWPSRPGPGAGTVAGMTDQGHGIVAEICA